MKNRNFIFLHLSPVPAYYTGYVDTAVYTPQPTKNFRFVENALYRVIEHAEHGEHTRFTYKSR